MKTIYDKLADMCAKCTKRCDSDKHFACAKAVLAVYTKDMIAKECREMFDYWKGLKPDKGYIRQGKRKNGRND